MFHFKDKTIFIISPERWGKMKVSKHHYALELAANNCRVYFIEPPNRLVKGIEISKAEGQNRLFLVRYRPVFRGKRMLPAFIYSQLIKLQIGKLKKKIGLAPDVILCFQGGVFQNLKWFGTQINIFFAVDLIDKRDLPLEMYSSDFCLAVSDTIYQILQKSGRPVFQINHGLQSNFVDNAVALLQNPNLQNHCAQLVTGYIGNLLMEALDRNTMMQVISNHPDVTFIFWGSYEKEDLNAGDFKSAEINSFIYFLKKQGNVKLRGVLPGHELLKEINEVNLFWLCWKIGISWFWDGSNSHKILEYLSTGHPVVSHYVSSYKETDLLYMLPSADNSGYPQLFNKVVEQVKRGESVDVIKKRLSFAISNSYCLQLQKIENIINDAAQAKQLNGG